MRRITDEEMLTNIEVALAIARNEIRASLRGWMMLAFASLFTLLCLGIVLAGLGGTGQILVQGFTRTGVSLLSLSVYLLPLLGMILGASAFGTEDGGTELLIAQPVERDQVLLGRALGLGGVLAMGAMVGFGVAGAVVAIRAGVGGMGGYVLVVAGAMAVGLAGLSVGMLLGIAARRRGAAVGWALTAWFAAAVLYDLAAIAVLQVAGNGQPGPWLVAILAFNPMDGVRTLGLVGLGADVLLGPTGAALRLHLGPMGGAGWVVGSLLLWLIVPICVAMRLYRGRDF